MTRTNPQPWGSSCCISFLHIVALSASLLPVLPKAFKKVFVTNGKQMSIFAFHFRPISWVCVSLALYDIECFIHKQFCVTEPSKRWTQREITFLVLTFQSIFCEETVGESFLCLPFQWLMRNVSLVVLLGELAVVSPTSLHRKAHNFWGVVFSKTFLSEAMRECKSSLLLMSL